MRDGMRPDDLADRLRGVIAFPVTPMLNDDDRSVDWDAYAAHVDFVCAAGVSAMVVAGGTGEMFTLTPAEIVELIRTGVRVVNHRIPVLAGVGFSPVEGKSLARYARDAGADGIVILPPYYPSPDASGLDAYYRAIASEVPDVGIVIYSRSGARITPEILRGLADTRNIVAMKDGHGDVRMFLRNRLALGRRYVWVAGAGDDLVGAYASAGAQAYTSSIACFDPALSIELWRLASCGAIDQLDHLMVDRVLPWYELRSRRAGYEVSVMKGAMEALGQKAGPVRAPLANLTPEDAADVRDLATRLGTWRGPD